MTDVCACGHDFGTHTGRRGCVGDGDTCRCKRFALAPPGKWAPDDPHVIGWDDVRRKAIPQAALYLRVSTKEQATENQRPDLEQLARQRGYHVAAVYEEQVSAAASSRPAFEAMLADAHRGRFHVILVWALDRFGRSMVGNLQAVLELDRREVQVVSYREPWLDMGGPMRKLLVAVFSWVAEQEREQLVARTKAGLDQARRKGIRLGRPPARLDLERARMLRGRGQSLRVVASELGVPLTVLVRAFKKQASKGEAKR